MAVPLYQTIPSILAISFCLVILILLGLNYLLNRFVPTIYLILFFTGMLLWAGTKLGSIFLPETMNENYVLIYKMSSLTILIVSLLIISYFRDLLVKDSLSRQSIFTSFLAGVTLTALWLGPFVKPQHAIFGDWLGPFVTVNYDALSGWNTDYSLGFLGILLLFLLVVYLFMFVLFIKGLRKATRKKQKRQIGLIITGLAIAALGGTALNYLLNLFEAFKSLGDLDIIFVVIGFAIVASAYLRSPIQIYFAPVSAYRLLVMNNHGIPLLTHDFCDFGEKAFIMDSSLISGALSGVISILKETLDSDSTPTVIHLDDRILLIEKTDSALYALITDSDSMVLRSALKDFGKEFEKAFKETLKDWKGMTDVFKDAYTLITEDFSFVITGDVKQEEEDEDVIIEDDFREEFEEDVIEDIAEELVDEVIELEPEEEVDGPIEEKEIEEDDLTIEEIIEDIDEALEDTEEEIEVITEEETTKEAEETDVDENHSDETF
ncbi:MAG: hypothetical protein KAJ76_02215 [Candidatus Heimdallarchaeota archaeon]|nr:hypothetical protein [Candidatus Heimdallarchaeota archaeon]